jgi:hypothetical protein
MTDSELHPYVELIAREARRPVVSDPAARERLMAAIRAEPVPSPRRFSRVWERLVQPRVFSLSPAGSALIAAGLVGIGVFAGKFVNNRDDLSRIVVSNRPPAVQPLPVSTVTDSVVQFVYVAPQAKTVSIVGDFNGWDATKAPLARVATGGLWTVTLPLSVGRHLYSFVVDGTWQPDPGAPRDPDDGFGHANSVKIVSRGSAL